ncbi:hypothetical protein LIER_03344 [Lithospermum erythrorhizon]|uniref:Uncharacterized protein n=1 Tax=Lithospermum erythrorhizon TaxID=34254 RepID=A0AAV3NUA6_LITER
MSGQQQPNASAPHADYQHPPFALEVKVIFQQGFAKSRRHGNRSEAHKSTQGHDRRPNTLRRTMSIRSRLLHLKTTSIAPQLYLRGKNKSAAPSQVSVPQVDPTVAALQQQSNDLKKMMVSVIPAGSAPSAIMTKMPFSDRLDSVALPNGFKQP